VIAFHPEWIIFALKALGVIAGVLAFFFFLAAAVLIVTIKRNPPEDWS